MPASHVNTTVAPTQPSERCFCSASLLRPRSETVPVRLPQNVYCGTPPQVGLEERKMKRWKCSRRSLAGAIIARGFTCPPSLPVPQNRMASASVGKVGAPLFISLTQPSVFLSPRERGGWGEIKKRAALVVRRAGGNILSLSRAAGFGTMIELCALFLANMPKIKKI